MPKKIGRTYPKPGHERQAQKARRDLERASKTMARSSSVWKSVGREYSAQKHAPSAQLRDASSGRGYALSGVRHDAVAPRPSLRYSMQIDWSDEDGAYVVTVPDLPGCMTHGATYREAALMGEEAIALWLEGARHWGRPIPLPDAAERS